MDKSLLENFNYIVSYTSPRIQLYLKKIGENIIENLQEIRIRANRPIVIVTHSGSSFLTSNGKLSYIVSSNCVFTSESEISDSINKMCGYSMHSHYEDILNGYITLPNGSRVGLTGTAVFDKDEVKGIKDFDGINIRIPRQIIGVSELIINNIFINGISNLIIVGPPSSGKTTMLKDLTYQLSSGRMGRYYKICVVDERKELACSRKDVNEIGPNTDVLLGFPKSKGISMAVRTLSPDVIICDEVGSDNEVKTILESMNTGVNFILSIHANGFDELRRKKNYNRLLIDGCFDNIVMLKGCSEPCIISEIIKNNEVIYERDDNCIYSNSEYCNSIKLHKAN